MRIGYHALGNAGLYAVAIFALLEFFGGGCMMLIIMWRILTDTLPVLGTPSQFPFKCCPHYMDSDCSSSLNRSYDAS